MNEDIGDKIKKIRISNNLKQKEFSKLIGVSQGTLSDIEAGKTKPSIDTISILNHQFDASLYWLMQDTNHIELMTQHLKYNDHLQELYLTFQNELDQKDYPSIQLDKFLIPTESFWVNLDPDEGKFVQLFRSLDQKNRKEIISIIQIKQGHDIFSS